MQATLDTRLKRWQLQLGNNVLAKRDIVLVMGKDRKELEEMMRGTVFALQTNPWRLEVGFWKSFVDVDVDFLTGLDRRWLE